MSVSPVPGSTRNTAMDTARGLAVAGMMLMHLVPIDGLGVVGTTVMEGNAAALFFILIGMAWAIQADRAGSSQGSRWLIARRSLALFVLGVLVHVLLWPTEVLVPFAVMLAPALWIRSGGHRALVIAIVVVLAVVLLGAGTFSSYAETDWMADGSHYADSTFGWVTLRYLLVDGNYPVIPWLAFPLLGMLFVRGGEMSEGRLRLWVVVGLALGVSMGLLSNWTASHEALGEATIYLATTWVPTTVPFMLMKGGLATALIAGLALWRRRSGLPGFCNPIASVGRASLTHYLAHICLVFVPLRLVHPDEDWPLVVGLTASVAYWAVAAPLTVSWFRSHKRGPLEQLLAWASGVLPPPSKRTGAPTS